jgi:hypothetical protein
MAADLPKNDWVSILKRNNALTRDNIRRALKHCKDEHERQSLQAELDRLEAKHSSRSKAGTAAASESTSTGRGFGVRRPRVEDEIEIPPEHQFFVSHLPRKIYCANDLEFGLKIRSSQQALTKRYVQFNGPGMVWIIAQDIDRQVDRDYFSKRKAPIPNRVVKNPNNNHAHAMYFLAAGVCKTDAARLKPLRYLAVVEGALCLKLEADQNYSGLITKNPIHHEWETWNLHETLFSLGDLARHLDLKAAANASRSSAKEARGFGRNVSLFDDLRYWSYRAIRDHWAPGGLDAWLLVVRDRADRINRQFPQPLPESEVRSTAKSVGKWTWRNITPAGLQELIQRTHTSEVQAERGRKATNQAAAGIASSAVRTPETQAERGRKATNQAAAGIASGEARRLSREQERATARLLRARGYTQQAIAEELGVTQRTVSSWLS